MPQRVCPDAVILVPGILGTELVDQHGEPVWGLGGAQLAKALVTGSIYDRMRDPTLQPGRLLRRVGLVPLLGCAEPYTKLSHTLERAVIDSAAFLEYPYDWRQPVTETAQQFAMDAAEHLAAWRRHRRGSAEARLSIVAHSMGGLVCLDALANQQSNLPTEDVRMVMTLGTPYSGSVKAVRALATGEVLPLNWAIRRTTKDRLRKFAVDVPAVYDLLPSFPSTYGSGAAHTTAGLRRATAEDFVAIGGRRDLVDAAIRARQARVEATKLPDWWAAVGTNQPTLQSFRHHDTTEFFEDVGGYDWAGDGTVHFHAAYPPGMAAGTGIPQSHGQIATSTEAVAAVTTRLFSGGGAIGPWQSVGANGLHVSDSVGRREPATVTVLSPVGVGLQCAWRDDATGTDGVIHLGPPTARTLADDTTVEQRSAVVAWSQPGLYTITLTGGSSSPITAAVLVEDET